MPASTLQALLSMLDRVLINYIAVCLASARNKERKKTRWLLAGTLRYRGCGSKAGSPQQELARVECWRIRWLSYGRIRRPDSAGLVRGSAHRLQQQRLTEWREHGYPVYALG